MKKTLALLLCALMLLPTLAACEKAPAEQPPETEPAPVTEPVRAEQVGDKEVIFGENMTLTFYDEFDGEELNTDVWMTEYWRGPHIHVDVADGNLVITVEQDEEGCVCGGAVNSRNNFEQAKGYFECSMKVQDIPGCWSAFWLDINGRENRIGNGGVDGVEIDIMEAVNYNWKGLNFALHWDMKQGTYLGDLAQFSLRPDIYDGEYHTFSFLWSDDMYIWYVDGEECYRTNESGICEVPLYLRASVEVGTWGGQIDPERIPGSVYYDYIRVYQFDDKLEQGGAE